VGRSRRTSRQRPRVKNTIAAATGGYGEPIVASQSLTNGSTSDRQVGLVQRDMANYLLGSSYYEQKLYSEAAQVLQRMHQRLSSRSEEYRGQSVDIGLVDTELGWCAARQLVQTKGRVAP